MKQGYGIFGKAYEIMYRNDLHAKTSIDHSFLRDMILLNEESEEYLYENTHIQCDLTQHELYGFAQRFQTNTDKDTVRKVLDFTSGIAKPYDIDFKEMLFGGTEKQILERGTDWCADMARVGTVLLQCLGIPCRIIHLANIKKAYNGHVLGEAFYEEKYGLVDFIYGYQFYSDQPLSALDIQKNGTLLSSYPEEYAGMFSAIAINEYNPINPDNDYTISSPNDYYLRLIYSDHHNQWIMNENNPESSHESIFSM